MEVYKVMFTGFGNMNVDELKSFICKNTPGTNNISLKSLDIEYGSRGIPVAYLTCTSKVNAEFISTKTNNKYIENLQISSKVLSKSIDYGTIILFNKPNTEPPNSAPKMPRHEPAIPSTSSIRPPQIPRSVQKPVIPKYSSSMPIRRAPDSPGLNNQLPQKVPENFVKPAKNSQTMYKQDSDSMQLPDNPIDSDAIEPEPAYTEKESNRRQHRSHRRHHHHHHHRRHHRHSYSSYSESSPDSYDESSSSSSDDRRRKHRSRKHSFRSKNSKDSNDSKQNNSQSEN